MNLKKVRMLKLIITSFILFAVSCFPVLSYAQNPAEGSGPKIMFGEESFDFGTVKEGDVGEHAFKVLNKGDLPVEIKAVNPS